MMLFHEFLFHKCFCYGQRFLYIFFKISNQDKWRDNSFLNALFSGGKIAGWTISGTTLVGANATLDGAGSIIQIDQGPQ